MVSSVFSGHHQFSFVSNVASQIIELLSVQSNVECDPELLNIMKWCSVVVKDFFLRLQHMRPTNYLNLSKVAAYVSNKLFKRDSLSKIFWGLFVKSTSKKEHFLLKYLLYQKVLYVWQTGINYYDTLKQYLYII